MTKCARCGLFYVQDRPHITDADCIDSLKCRLKMTEARTESIRTRTCRLEQKVKHVSKQREAAEDIAKGFVTRRELHEMKDRMMRLEQRYGFLLREMKGQTA